MRGRLIRAVAFLPIFASTFYPAKAQQPSELASAIDGLKKQQLEIVGNQTKIDEKMADLIENIRLARLYMSRGGGKHKPLPIPKK